MGVRTAGLLAALLLAALLLVACSSERPRSEDDDSGGIGGAGASGGSVSSAAGGDGGSGGEAPDLLVHDPWPPRCTATCAGAEVCVGAVCCPPPVRAGSFALPAHTSWVDWSFSAPLAELEFDIYVGNDPGEGVGLYFAPASSTIDGTQFYFGMQTLLYEPNVGPTTRGLLFSRWDTLDPADTRAARDGYIELGTHEGEFAGVRLNYPWSVGWYRLRLERMEADGPRDWFDLHIVELPGGADTFVGGLRFPRSDPGTPATISASSIGFTEVYSGATDYMNVPQWHIQTRARGDGDKPAAASASYPAFPHAEYPNTDVFYSPGVELVHLTFGGMTPRCHPAGALF